MRVNNKTRLRRVRTKHVSRPGGGERDEPGVRKLPRGRMRMHGCGLQMSLSGTSASALAGPMLSESESSTSTSTSPSFASAFCGSFEGRGVVREQEYAQVRDRAWCSTLGACACKRPEPAPAKFEGNAVENSKLGMSTVRSTTFARRPYRFPTARFRCPRPWPGGATRSRCPAEKCMSCGALRP